MSQNYYTTLEGGHKTVAQTAMALHEAGEAVKVLNGRTTKKIDPDRDYTVTHHDNRTVLKDAETEVVQVNIREDSDVTVRHNGVGE